ncbi:MAG TPA: hypothetical protein VMU06_10855 [Stellaceae bacterium]|nr:hypothetical protein [Stellaceae bacterium]
MTEWQRALRAGLVSIALISTMAACQTRSISNSGYEAGNAYVGGHYPYPGYARDKLYRGELAELDVLGIDTTGDIDNAKITRTRAEYRRPALRRGSSVLLVQSGAMLPDEAMSQALGPYFDVQPFSGVPEGGRVYATALRLAAARAGADTVICYWGVLESAVEREGTKVVSWVPIIGTFIPDETQHMRIRLKVAVIDVRSGDWSVFAPDSRSDSALSANLDRGGSDQRQVLALKAMAYKAAAEQLVASYAP